MHQILTLFHSLMHMQMHYLYLFVCNNDLVRSHRYHLSTLSPSSPWVEIHSNAFVFHLYLGSNVPSLPLTYILHTYLTKLEYDVSILGM